MASSIIEMREYKNTRSHGEEHEYEQIKTNKEVGVSLKQSLKLVLLIVVLSMITSAIMLTVAYFTVFARLGVSMEKNYVFLMAKQTEIHALVNTTRGVGTTYIRWSRKECSNNNNTELVYSGYAGTGPQASRGAAAETVCLPHDPDFNKTSGHSGNGIISGVEIWTNFFSKDSRYQDVPCAVCRVKQVSSVIMIPGKNRCYTGWNQEYYGYLATSALGNSASGSFICIDIQPEYANGGSSSDGKGRTLWDVVPGCGVLPCPPYTGPYPLTCTVCSK